METEANVCGDAHSSPDIACRPALVLAGLMLPVTIPATGR